MIFMPSLSMWEYLDKFGKTVSVVEWIVYLNNSLLASETSLFQTICKMTDFSHLLKNNTWKVTVYWAPSHWISETDHPVPHLKWFQHGPPFHKLKCKNCTCWERLFVCCLTNNISFDRQTWLDNDVMHFIPMVEMRGTLPSCIQSSFTKNIWIRAHL